MALKTKNFFSWNVLFFFVFSVLNLPFPTNLFAAEVSKRTLAVLAFNPAQTPEDLELLKVATKRISASKKFYIVPEPDATKFALKYIEEGDLKSRQLILEAKDLLDQGKEQYDRLQFYEAIRTLKLSIKKYGEALPYIKDGTDILRALIYLGMAYISQGDKKNGQRYITDALRIDPERKTRKLSESLFPPNIRAIFQARQDIVRKYRGAKLTVVSSPPGTNLYVDGFSAGTIPDSKVIDDLPPGNHFLMVEKVGYARFFKKVRLGKEDQTVSAILEKWSPFAAIPVDSISETTKERYREIARELGAEVLLLGSLKEIDKEEYAVSVQLFDSKDSSFSKVEQIKFENLKKSAKYCKKTVTNLLKDNLTNYNEVIAFSYEETPVVSMPKEVVGEVPVFEEKKGRSIFSKWWFWAIVAGAAGGGTVLAVTGKSSPSYNLIRISK